MTGESTIGSNGAPGSPARSDMAIVDWQAGAPIYAGASAPNGHGGPAGDHEAVATRVPGAVFWVLKPGDMVCDWFAVTSPDGRGLLRLMINLTLYCKAAAIIAFVIS